MEDQVRSSEVEHRPEEDSSCPWAVVDNDRGVVVVARFASKADADKYRRERHEAKWTR